ncbi:MAG: flippase, partial [Dysgonamonadaceae bacterium]|jgi:PST family polysaccharide transporter|nr:flippase [Dysgonamonadaceae bacterium]
VLGLSCGTIAVGYYSAAEKLYQAYNNLLVPITGVMFPHIAKTRNVAFFKRVLKFVVPANFVLLTVIMLGSFWLILLVCGEVRTETLTVFRILMCACVATIPSILIGYPFLAAMGHVRYTNWTLIGISFFHLAGLTALYLSGYLSIYNVAIMVILTESLVLAFRAGGIVKYKLFRTETVL